MAVMTGGALVGAMAVGGALGAIGGKKKDIISSEVDAGDWTPTEQYAQDQNLEKYKQLADLVNAGPGLKDAEASIGASRSLADLLKKYSEEGALPTDADTARATRSADMLFNPQQLALKNAFENQNIEANRLATQLGRTVNDPIIQAKLRESQARDEAMLGANKAAFSYQMAQQSPLDRLGFAQDRTNVLQQLSAQAMANRQALISTGMNLQGADRSLRVATAKRSQHSGGGVKGMINGGFAGAGAGLSMASSVMGAIGGMGGGGGGLGGLMGGSGGGGSQGPATGASSGGADMGGGVGYQQGGGMMGFGAATFNIAQPNRTFTTYGPNPPPSYLSSQSNLGFGQLLNYPGFARY